MSWRTVIIERRCKLDYRMGYMVVRGQEVKRIFLEEIALLVIENPAISLTGCLLEQLVNQKIRVIFCDQKRSPFAELVPHHGCHDSAGRIKGQIQWTAEAKGRVWQSIIREKIKKQADFLNDLCKDREYELLIGYLPQILPHDATNREGHAAKVYFNALFGMDFTRGMECPVNAALNYGYSVLLSAFNRELSAMGLLTQLGVHHDNRFNHFNLSCDLMEPWRILVDRRVVEMAPETFETEHKRKLWQVLNDSVRINATTQTVLNALRIYARTVAEALATGEASGIAHYSLSMREFVIRNE